MYIYTGVRLNLELMFMTILSGKILKIHIIYYGEENITIYSRQFSWSLF